MTGPLPVRIVGSAASAIADAARWWAANREKAPDAFYVDLDRALTLIASRPEIGATSRNPLLAGIRRIYLARVRYHVYYRVITTPAPAIEVLAVWHSSRGSEPMIR